MDVVEKLIADHKTVAEQTNILKKLIQMAHADTVAWDNTTKIKAFFDDEIGKHFQLEEKVLFPVIRKVLPPEKLGILNEIENEHKPILEILKEFEKSAKKHSSLKSNETRLEFTEISRKLIEALIPHAKKEDEKLFPLVLQLFKDENYREIEVLYFKYLKV